MFKFALSVAVSCVAATLSLADGSVSTNGFVRDGVAYSRRGALGKDDFVVTNVAERTGEGRYLPKYLHLYQTDDVYTNDAAWYYSQPRDYGNCSAVKQGNYLYRNFDFLLDERAEFVVSVSGNDDRFASVGVANCGTNLTERFVSTHQPSRYYKALAGSVVDGVNENGVAVEINLVDGEPEWENPSGDIHPLAAVRWTLDNAKDALDAATNLATRIMFPQGWTQNFHWLVCDTGSCYVVENGSYSNMAGRAVMTNFKLNPKTYGTGWERYMLLTDTFASITNAWYTRAYSRDTEWVSEFKSLTEMEAAKHAWETHTKEQLRGHGLWQTVHTSIYDLQRKTLKICVQESDDWYVFKVPTGGTDEDAVREIAEAVVAPVRTTAWQALDEAATADTHALMAQATADNAKSLAQTAQDTADQAVSAAATAQSTADEAIDEANAAYEHADDIAIVAENAQETADQAETDAATAQATAEAAQDLAQTAKDNADTALSMADEAIDEAYAAFEHADDIAIVAENAQETADQAVTDAATAQTTAENALSIAEQAEADAQSAQATADFATISADEAKEMISADNPTFSNEVTTVVSRVTPPLPQNMLVKDNSGDVKTRGGESPKSMTLQNGDEKLELGYAGAGGRSWRCVIPDVYGEPAEVSLEPWARAFGEGPGIAVSAPGFGIFASIFQFPLSSGGGILALQNWSSLSAALTDANSNTNADCECISTNICKLIKPHIEPVNVIAELYDAKKETLWAVKMINGEMKITAATNEDTTVFLQANSVLKDKTLDTNWKIKMEDGEMKFNALLGL